MNILFDPDVNLRPQPAAPADTTADTGGWADLLTGALGNPYTLTALATLTAVLTITLTIRTIRRRNTTRTSGSLDKALTFFAAAVATGVVGTGMWAFFEDTLGVTNPYLRAALFAFFELAMLAEALRSRSFRIDRARRQATDNDDTRELDVDGIAVWALAFASGALAATHEPTWGGRALRLIAPAVAAWLWERGLAGELRQYRVRRTGRPNLARVLWDRTLVALGLADAAEMSMTDRAAARLMDRLARARFKVTVLEAAEATPVALWWARMILRRRFLAACTKLDLAGRPDLRRSLQERIAVLTGADTGTSPEAVAHLDPWAPQPTDHTPTAADRPESTGTDHTPETIDGVVVDHQPTTPTNHTRPAPTNHTSDRPNRPTNHSTDRRPTGPTTTRPTTNRPAVEQGSNVKPLWSPAAVANATVLRQRFGNDLPDTDRKVRDAMGWSHDRTVAAIRAYRAGADRPTTPTTDRPTGTDHVVDDAEERSA